MKKWEKFSRDEIEQFVKESKSNREVARKIGYDQNSGSAMKSLREMYKELNIDTSHFTGQGWNKNNFDYSRFVYGKKIKTSDALNAIVLLRGYKKCENCGLEEWQGKPIPLEIHHIDGDGLNSEPNNLQMLCPNCHALTDNYKGRNINSGVIVVSDEELVNALNEYPNIRQALIAVGLTGKGGNYIRANELIQKYQIKKYLQ